MTAAATVASRRPTASSSIRLDRRAGLGAGATAIGQLAGFACSLAALLAVALMARIPIVTNVVGSDRSVRWHRWAAVATVALLAVHIVATVAGYSVTDRVSAAHELSTLVTTYPWMLAATPRESIRCACCMIPNRG